MKLPRKLETLPQHEPLQALLSQNLKSLWKEGEIRVPALPFQPQLEKALVQAMTHKQLERGLERIEQVLQAEKKGLDAVQKKQGTAPSHRISRILLMTQDGAERFYRSCEVLLRQHGDRVLGLFLETDSNHLGLRLFGPDKAVKALLVSDKEAVVQVLLSLVEP